MKNPCGTTQATVIEVAEVNGIQVYFGSGVNPVNSPAQFFVAWGTDILANGLVRTFNIESAGEGILWFIDEDDAEAKFHEIKQILIKDAD